ncbi:P27 family phage terminase small subunit [Paenibacillus sp. sptzw28]|uniref:P27 family phage terminase small subunit n=1 Tax=Paenibacillus sp. sptzw28 TaxID=715179 RepID=UPI001C6E53BD|nr:P27 family phage terminase small subunit [Paenibacillus sp. sptzw28]QYR20810.1 P27 family phage terminase small subunit [Paenibacillus sp. sptzw28]
MPGRNAKSIGLHLAEGNPSHLTKEEIEARKAAEVKLGEQDLAKLKKPSFITKDKAANKLWNELIKEYKSAAKQGVELLTSSDIGMLAMYCKTFSEYERLLIQYQRIENIVIDEDVLHEFIDGAVVADQVNYKALQYLSQLASLEGVLKIETAINKKMDMLLKMQDRLFLNPLAKVKNVPKPKQEKKESAMAKFMNRRAGGGNAP